MVLKHFVCCGDINLRVQSLSKLLIFYFLYITISKLVINDFIFSTSTMMMAADCFVIRDDAY